MDLRKKRLAFEHDCPVHAQAKLTFRGVDGYDVYNPSIPFLSHGQSFLYGRVERRAEWARSTVRLFTRTGPDEWTLVPDAMVYPLEDPFVSCIGPELVMGGTHVRFRSGAIETYYGYFYRGTEPGDLRYFTTGPDYMKDIRLVDLQDGRIGVFSRPRSEEILRRFGAESQVGFTIITSLDGLTSDVIEEAPYIEGIFGAGEWGGCNQAYFLEDGMIGVVGHQSYHDRAANGRPIATYLNIAFVFDPERRIASEHQIIGTRSCYPAGPAKRADLVDCAFTSGIVMRADGKADLYSGIGDTEAGRIVIDYPFAVHGRILTPDTATTPAETPMRPVAKAAEESFA